MKSVILEPKVIASPYRKYHIIYHSKVILNFKIALRIYIYLYDSFE